MNKTGLHIISTLYDCGCDYSYLLDEEFMSDFITNLIKCFGLNSIDSIFHSFGSNQGFTGMILLAESHFSIHTWPELNKIDLDIYVCNYTQDNSQKAKNIYNSIYCLFCPKEEKYQEIER